MNEALDDNPLLITSPNALPAFDRIRPEHVLPALQAVLAEGRAQVEALCAIKAPDWTSLMQPLAAIEERISRVWGPVVHLNAVCDSDALRPVYQQGVSLMAAWQSELAQNQRLFAAIRTLADSDAFAALNTQQQQVVRHMLRDFRLAGAELEEPARSRFRDIRMRLSELGTDFEQHVLDATRAFELHLRDAQEIQGLPPSVIAAARQRAESDGRDGWLFTLDAPSYIPFMQYADRRDLRETMYRAYVTRASEGELDNGPLIDEMLQLRQEAAELLGFSCYADWSLATKMASSVGEVTGFLQELAAKSRPFAERDLARLRQFAADQLQLHDLQAWDIAYASEKLRQQTYAVSQEELKPYFPEYHVLAGMFALVERLYGITIREQQDAPCWHDDVRFFRVFRDEQVIAGFYFDPYARPHKRGGAWMDECLVRWRTPDGTLQLPVAYLVCNFDAPVGDRPALWTHDEVTTLFHEFGHGLHHMLTEVCELEVSGIRGVPWDAVELPSQFMENFCWQKEAVQMFARHVDTGETIPDTLFARMLAAKNFQSALQMLRQIEFALFDMRLHAGFDPARQSVQDVLDEVRREVAVIRPPAFNRFQNSFSHIFAGGYAAGYFSYKWAEVLSADVFAAFEEDGILNRETAERFRRCILSVGGSRDIMQAFIDFRGRRPSVEPLLRHAGLLDAAAQATGTGQTHN